MNTRIGFALLASLVVVLTGCPPRAEETPKSSAPKDSIISVRCTDKSGTVIFDRKVKDAAVSSDLVTVHFDNNTGFCSFALEQCAVITSATCVTSSER